MSKAAEQRQSTETPGLSVRARPSGEPAQSATNPFLGLQRTLGNQAVTHLLESGIIQPKLRVSQPGDADEQEADRVADQIVSRQHAPAIQRKCACAGGASCSKCAHEEEELIHRKIALPGIRSFPLSLQRAPADQPTTQAGSAQSTSSPSTTSAGVTHPPSVGHAHSLIVEDDAPAVAPGQMRRTQFITLLQTTTCATADAVLASVGHTTQGCPYIKKWLAFYSHKNAQFIARAMHKYAPDTEHARTAHEAIAMINHRVHQAALTWAKTGKVSGLPPELQAELAGGSGGGFLGAVAGFASSGFGSALLGFLGGGKKDTEGGGIKRKAQDGASAPAHDAAAVQSQLGSGHALDSRVQSQMSSAFGYDFSSVRVHTDAKAGDLSANLNARAFTIGSDIAFAGGEYQPGTLIGDALIAHELAHVVQQGGGQQTNVPLQKGTESGQLEDDADKSAIGAMVSIWTGSQKGLAHISTNAMPRLRSGLRLQSCNCKNKAEPAPKAEPEIACTAQAIGQNVADCMTRANKQPYSCTQGIHYAVNYQRECPDKWKDDYNRGFADPEYFEQLEGYWDWRLKPRKSASAAIKKWLSGLTIAECFSTAIACEIDAVRAAIGDARFDALYGSSDTDIPEDRRLRVGTNTFVPNVWFGGLVTHTEAATSGAGTPGNRPVKIGEWYYFQNHPMYLKKHPGGAWQGENAVYVGVGPEGKQLWIGLGSSTGPPLNRPEVTEDQMIDEMLEAYNADPWGPDLPEFDRIRASHGGVLPPDYQPKSAANPTGYPSHITKQQLLDAGGGFVGSLGKTLDVNQVKGLKGT